MKKNKIKEQYPWIKKLGIEIKYEGDIPYITAKQLKKSLTKEQMEKISVFYGCSTGILIKNGDLGMYPIDIERCLCQLFTGKLEHPLLWD